MRFGVRAVVAVTLLALGACGNTAGIPEFHHYRQAAAAQHAAGLRVLDRLAQSERALMARISETGPGFDPDRAAGYLGIGMPPRTARLRRGLDLLRGYNEALAELADGSSASRSAAELEIVLVNLGHAAGALSGPAARGPFQALARSLDRAAPVLALLTTADDREEFRRRLVDAHPQVRSILIALRDATRAIWTVLAEAKVRPGDLSDARGLTREARTTLEADRQSLAAWVVLIDQSIVAMEAAVAAAETDEQRPLVALVEASIRLRALAEAVDVARLR